MSKKPLNKKHASSATLPQSVNPNQTAAAPFSTPKKIGKFFLVFFLCVAGFALLQRLGGFFGLFTQLSNRFKKAWEESFFHLTSDSQVSTGLIQATATTPSPTLADLTTPEVPLNATVLQTLEKVTYTDTVLPKQPQITPTSNTQTVLNIPTALSCSSLVMASAILTPRQSVTPLLASLLCQLKVVSSATAPSSQPSSQPSGEPSSAPSVLTTTFTNSTQLKTAADLYCQNITQSDAQYGPIQYWDVSQITDMDSLFKDCLLNPPISAWNVSAVTNMYRTFLRASSFNQAIGAWDVSQVTSMKNMFNSASSFNQAIGAWDVSKVTDMHGMFYNTPFDQAIGTWDVSAVTDMNSMFRYASSFNQDISAWNVSAVTDMGYMFYIASNFNHDIGAWNVSQVTNMHSMVRSAYSFNQDISTWDVSAVTIMAYMFRSTPFNQDISAWNVSEVTNMYQMFYYSYNFNQAIGVWDVSSVNNMGYMFEGASSFSQQLCWDVSGVDTTSWLTGTNGATNCAPPTSQPSSSPTQALECGINGVFDLSDINGVNGVRINGEVSNDYSGYSVSGAGDVNGDGIADIIIGAYGADPSGGGSGASYVVFGGHTLLGSSTFELASLDGSNGFKLNGVNTGDRSGLSVSDAGDLNQDGFADIIIGADYADPNGKNAGASYVVFGNTTVGHNGVLALSSLNGDNGFSILGETKEDYSGISVSNAGDVNGDGTDDVIIGAHYADGDGFESGQSYVIFGNTQIGASGSLSLSSLNGTHGFVINGETAGDLSGSSVSGAGDVNGDGFADIIIGAYYADPHGSNSGASYVVFGSTTIGNEGVFALASLDGHNGFKLQGELDNDNSGYSVSDAGDVNGDGYADIIIGARYADPHGTNSGTSYVVYGSAIVGSSGVLQLSSLDGQNGFKLNGEAAYDWSGISVSGAGDINGDGFDDVIIGAYTANPYGTNSGSSYVVYGSTIVGSSGVLQLSSLDGQNGFKLNGEAAYDYSGISVSFAGDVNHDGRDDIIIGAYGVDDNGSSSGASYLVFCASQLFRSFAL